MLFVYISVGVGLDFSLPINNESKNRCISCTHLKADTLSIPSIPNYIYTILFVKTFRVVKTKIEKIQKSPPQKKRKKRVPIEKSNS